MAVEHAAILLLLDPQNVLRALDAGQQIGAVRCGEEAAEGLDAADDKEKVVLSRQRKTASTRS
jgi:hypothetical protein